MTGILSSWLAGSIVLAGLNAAPPVSVDKMLAGEGDIVLERALRPRSGERIDCRGRIIRGAPVLIYLRDVEDVTVENCIFTDGEFAVIAVRGGGHVFRSNQFWIRDTAIELVGSSGNEIRDNVASGPFMFLGNADHNRVHHNVIRSRLGVGAGWSPGAAVYNYIVDGELTQVLNERDMLDDLRVWNNDIELVPAAEDGFVGVGFMGGTRDTRAWNNTIRGGLLGVASWGYEDFVPFVMPGECSRDRTRRCEADEDCFIRGFDRAPKGACVGVVELPSEGKGRVIRSTFSGNVISGAWAGVEAFLAPSTRIDGNDISSCEVGIRIGDLMLESGTVVGNVVRGNQVGLAITNMWGTYAGVDMRFNDFIDNAQPDYTESFSSDCPDCPITRSEYGFPTDLSLNHWGSTCPPRFNDSDLDGSPAYEAPVAQAYRAAVAAGGTVEPLELGLVCE
jgi:hypothetical protein